MIKRLMSHIFPSQPARARLADETDSTFLLGGRGWLGDERDRQDYDRAETLGMCLEAWRLMNFNK
jgi:hypothetical protein